MYANIDGQVIGQAEGRVGQAEAREEEEEEEKEKEVQRCNAENRKPCATQQASAQVVIFYSIRARDHVTASRLP